MISARKSSLRAVSDAQKLWPHLNGVFCVYKPSNLTINQTRFTIISNICRDLNELSVRPPRKRVLIEPSTDCKYIVKTQNDLSDHVLVVGDRYQNCDIIMSGSHNLGKLTSGVMTFGLNRGAKMASRIRDNRPIRVYHVTGKLGKSTESHFYDSPTTAKATFDHVHLGKLNSLLTSLQASHQRKMYEMCGVDMQSQSAYELAIKGPIRPAISNIPLIYSIRCIEYKRPYFTLEIHACNESENYLGILINEIGIELKSLAYCSQIRCIRESHFTLEDALVKRHWNVEALLGNLKRCRDILLKHPEIIAQTNPILENMNKEQSQ
ncbi:hypothetical protein ACKWTF_009223 [Chironomus riparius]